MHLEITVYNTIGEVVFRDVCEPQTVTEAEVNEIVALIEGGTTACVAAMLVKQDAR